MVGLFLSPLAEAHDDWELWTELRWKKPLSERVALQGVFSGRFRRDMGEFYRQLDEMGLGYKWFPWLKLEGAYQWNFSERPRTHDTVQEHRLYGSFTPSLKLGVFQIENRNRLEFRHINGVDDWRYRNRSKAGVLLGESRWWRIKPYLSDEIFYGFRAGEINRNRLTAGIERPLSQKLSVELFYVLESNKTGKDWDEFNALGVAANVVF